MNSKILALVTGIFLLLGCDKPEQSSQVNTMVKTMPAASGVITGQVMYRERKMLPPGAQLTVTLEDVSKMDVASQVIATSSQVIQGGPPYKFSLTYDKSAIEKVMQYSLRAQIKLAERLLFTSTERLDPFGQAERPIEITLSMIDKNTTVNDLHSAVKSAADNVVKAETGLAIVSVDPLADLVNTYWKLISIGDNEITMNSSQQREAFLQLSTENNSVKGFSGCNNYRGSYQVAGNSLSFGAMASTKKACMTGMDTEAKMMAVLAGTAHYSIHKNTLTLLNVQKKPTAVFEAMYFN